MQAIHEVIDFFCEKLNKSFRVSIFGGVMLRKPGALSSLTLLLDNFIEKIEHPAMTSISTISIFL